MKHLIFLLTFGIFFIACEDHDIEDITGRNRFDIEIPSGSIGLIQIKNTYDFVIVKVTYNQPGSYAYEWDGKNESGLDVDQGMYFVEFYLNDRLGFREIILIE